MIGTGILKGMAVTARNFVGSYFEKERLTTVQYPEERSPLPENYRNFPFLIFDGNDPHAGRRWPRQRSQRLLQPLRRNLRQAGRCHRLLHPKRLREASLASRRWDVFPRVPERARHPNKLV